MEKSDPVDPGVGWRLLGPDEIICEGDEVIYTPHAHKCHWDPADSSIGSINRDWEALSIRRKLVRIEVEPGDERDGDICVSNGKEIVVDLTGEHFSHEDADLGLIHPKDARVLGAKFYRNAGPVDPGTDAPEDVTWGAITGSRVQVGKVGDEWDTLEILKDQFSF